MKDKRGKYFRFLLFTLQNTLFLKRSCFFLSFVIELLQFEEEKSECSFKDYSVIFVFWNRDNV